MDNKGRVVVFMSMMTAVFLVLITVCAQVCIQSAAKSKTVIAGRLSVSDVKACYNRYIFDHYHILLFDKTADGKGEAYLEEQLEDSFTDKLGDGYSDTQVRITEFTMLCDNECAAFVEQMRETSVYLLAEDGAQAGVDEIREKTAGTDGTLPEDLESDMEDAQEEADSGQTTSSQTESGAADDARTENMQTGSESAERGQTGGENGNTENAEADGGQEGLEILEPEADPRDYTKGLSNSAILNLVLPEDDKTVSTAGIEADALPSMQMSGWFSDYQEIDRDFDGMSEMITGLQELGSWQDCLADTASQAIYAEHVFNSYLEEKNDTAVLAYEQEYLIAGKSSDYENLKSVAHRIIGIRFPINYIGLCGQTDKMAKLTAMATSIAGVAPYLIPAIKYLLAGCWAYIESIADARVLFDGKKAAFVKTSENWITDIEHIGESLSEETEDVESGLDYQAYLTILQLMQAEGTRHRMLDLIEINTRQETPNFRISHAAVSVEADFETNYGDRTYRFHHVGAY